MRSAFRRGVADIHLKIVLSSAAGKGRRLLCNTRHRPKRSRKIPAVSRMFSLTNAAADRKIGVRQFDRPDSNFPVINICNSCCTLTMAFFFPDWLEEANKFLRKVSDSVRLSRTQPLFFQFAILIPSQTSYVLLPLFFQWIHWIPVLSVLHHAWWKHVVNFLENNFVCVVYHRFFLLATWVITQN